MNANKLRAKIKENGLTQEKVAKIIGISPNSLSRKLSGKKDFRLGEVILLCRALRIENAEEIFLR